MIERPAEERRSEGTGRPRGTVLLVDDETYVRDSLSRLLGRRGFGVRTASSTAATVERAASRWTPGSFASRKARHCESA